MVVVVLQSKFQPNWWMAGVLSAVNLSVAKKHCRHQLVAKEKVFWGIFLETWYWFFVVVFCCLTDYQRDLVDVIFWLIIIIIIFIWLPQDIHTDDVGVLLFFLFFVSFFLYFQGLKVRVKGCSFLFIFYIHFHTTAFIMSRGHQKAEYFDLNEWFLLQIFLMARWIRILLVV